MSAYITTTASLLYKYQGNLGAYLIVGGYDVLGGHLVMLSAEGKYYYFHLVTPTYPTPLWVQVHFTL